MPYERALAIRNTAVSDARDPGSLTFNLMPLNSQVSLLLTGELIFVVAYRVAMSGSYGGLDSLFAIPCLPPLGAMSSKEENKRFSTRYNSHPIL